MRREHSTVKTQIAEMQRAKSLLQEMKGEITSQQEKNINLKKQYSSIRVYGTKTRALRKNMY